MRWINCDQRFMPHLAQVLGMCPTPHAISVAEFEDEKPICGAIYDGYNGRSIHSHLWIAPGRVPSRLFWFTTFDYMFRQCQIETGIGTVPSSNVRAQKLDEHLGYRLNTVIPNYYPNGDDMLLYTITRETAMDWERFKPRDESRIVVAGGIHHG